MPLAYDAYALIGLLFAISYPGNDLQLKSVPRIIMPIPPILMGLT